MGFVTSVISQVNNCLPDWFVWKVAFSSSLSYLVSQQTIKQMAGLTSSQQEKRNIPEFIHPNNYNVGDLLKFIIFKSEMVHCHLAFLSDYVGNWFRGE